MIIVPGIYQRMAELWLINKKQGLTAAELTEFYQCLSKNAEYCSKRAKLENLSLAASMTGDTDWQHEICGKIEQLDLTL